MSTTDAKYQLAPPGRAPHKADVDAERAVDARAREADVHAIGHRRPGRVLGGAVEAHLVGGTGGRAALGADRAQQGELSSSNAADRAALVGLEAAAR